MSPKVSVVTLNWERPFNLKTILLPLLETYSCVDEIIISHGRPDTLFEYQSDRCRIVHRYDYAQNERYDMGRRFLAVMGASNEVVLSLDDDIIMSEAVLVALCGEFDRDPEVIHSLYGRNPNQELRYSDRTEYGSVTYALIGAALMQRGLARSFFEYAPLVSGLDQDKRWPFSTVEDMFMSLVALKINRRLNRAHPLHNVRLLSRGAGAPVALSERANHLPDRSRFSQLAIPALGVRDLVKISGPDNPRTKSSGV